MSTSIRAGVAFAIALIGAACSGDSPIALKTTPGDMLWSLRATIGAATVAIGGTQQLGAKAYLADGTLASNTPPVTYVSTNPTKVQVSSSGLVTGLAVTSAPAVVVASMATPSITLVDTILVAVTATAHPLKTFTLHSGPTSFAQAGSLPIPLTATDSNDAAVSGLAVKYTSLNPAIFYVNGSSLIGATTGTAALIASTTSYGVAHADTLNITVTNPMVAYIYCYNKANTGRDFSSATTIIGVGGTVNFYNFLGSPITITFDDPTNITGGNIVNLATSTLAVRVFTAAGTYNFHNQTGGTATVVVIPNN
jgi:hypothetical protein